MPEGKKKSAIGRSEVSFLFAIVLGLALGIMIKKIRVGILLGMALGFFIIITGWLKSTRK
jgi:hypothetical protein